MSDGPQVQTALLSFLRREVFRGDFAISEDTDLVESGFDSLSLTQLRLFIERTYGLWIPEKEITETSIKNARSVTALVVRLLGEAGSSRWK